MSRPAKTLERVLRGTSDATVAFSDLCGLLNALGFDERIRGSHHIFTMEGVEEILNLQPKGSQAKAYQVRQVRTVIVRYRLARVLGIELPDGEGPQAAPDEPPTPEVSDDQ